MDKFKLTVTDFIKSLYYGALVPALVEIQSLLENGLSSISWSMIGKIAIGSVLAHLIRKALQKTPETVSVAKASDEGDPLKPKKPPVKPGE